MSQTSHNHYPRKRFGQHFLTDPAIIDQIITSFAPLKGERIVEIGPGTGRLTGPLLARVDTLDVIELDRDLARCLREDRTLSNLRVHEGDVLNFSFLSLAGANEKLRLIGNLPYNISTPLIFHLLNQIEVISDMTFMLQKEVADRMTAETGTRQYGRLSVMLQVTCDTEPLFNVPPEAFTPPPKVMSTVIRLQPKTDPPPLEDHQLFSKLIRQAFSQRRKTLHNVLKGFVQDEVLEAAGISPSARADTIDVDSWVRLANILAIKSP